jgi:hypothetical protein
MMRIKGDRRKRAIVEIMEGRLEVALRRSERLAGSGRARRAAAAKIAALPVAGDFLWANRPSCRPLAATIRDAVKTEKMACPEAEHDHTGGAVHERIACGAAR